MRGVLKYAERAASLSSASFHRVGAAIFRGGSLLSLGWNSLKTHPASTTRYHGQHAEFAALIGTRKEEIVGSTIFVVRLTKASHLGISKPCEHCERILRAAGVKKVWFLDENAQHTLMKL